MLVTNEGVPMDTDALERDVRAPMVMVGLLVVVVAQVSRLLFPVMFEIGEDWDFLAAGGVALAVFAAPVVAMPFARLGRRTALVAGSAGAGGALVIAQFLDPIPAVVAIALVATALVGGTLVLARLDDGSLRAWLVFAVLLGLALDVSIRAVARTWDLPWQDGVTPRIVGVILAVGLLGAALTAAVAAGGESVSWAVSLRPSALVVAGALAAVELLFLTNIGFVSAHVELTLAPATAVVLVGLLVAVLAWTVAQRVLWAPWLNAVLALLAVAIGWILPTATGPTVVLLVVVLQAALWVLFALVVGRPPDSVSSPARVAGAAAGGSVLFLAIVLLWQLDIDQPLPFPRVVVSALAVGVVALAALRRTMPDASMVAVNVRSVVVAIAALAIVVPLGLWATSVDPATDSGEAVELRLVSYNVRGAVDVEGQLRPDRVASEILTSDPDVVVLQEVGRGWPIHSTLDLLAYLGRELDMGYVFAPAADGQFGNAILSDLPMQEVDSGLLPDDGSQERSYLMVEVATATGPVTVVGTHVHTRSVPQIEALLDAVGDRTPVVVAGDMNTDPTDPEVALFTDTGLIDVVGATGDQCQTTSAEPTSSCDRPDWVFVSPDIRVDAVRIGDTVASDHLAIHTSLRLR
jgi:endonuclease/exonuclease/phosphatase family metal-dependent hydrolase